MIGNNGYYQPYTFGGATTPAVVPQNTVLVNTFGIVQNIDEAKGWVTAPGTSVMLMNLNNSKFYIKTVDATGFTQPLRAFRFEEEKDDSTLIPSQEYVTKEDFEELKKTISELKKSDYKKGNK